MPDVNRSRKYRFTFGPWNISMGADPFGPPVRKEVAFAAKIREYKKLGFDGVQFHDDDAVPPDAIDADPATVEKHAAKMKKVLDGEGLFCEFVAPRLWEHPKTIDGGYTSNSASESSETRISRAWRWCAAILPRCCTRAFRSPANRRSTTSLLHR